MAFEIEWQDELSGKETRNPATLEGSEWGAERVLCLVEEQPQRSSRWDDSHGLSQAENHPEVLDLVYWEPIPDLS